MQRHTAVNILNFLERNDPTGRVQIHNASTNVADWPGAPAGVHLASVDRILEVRQHEAEARAVLQRTDPEWWEKFDNGTLTPRGKV